ncbi:MAG: ABC transporter substrate-binding protein [Deltaproteobacteria bacterium]|nr:ABC transporter substrate-binding protein [Deltaproteobacteria bacterium]
MDNRIVISIVGLVLFLTIDPACVQAASTTKVVIMPASFSEREGILVVAQDQGFFRKRELDVQLVYVRTGSVAMSALTAGESHFFHGSASGATLGAIAGGVDVVLVAGLINKPTGAFVVVPEIKVPSDLRGKTLGVNSIGGGNWMFAVLALDHWGLDLKRDRINLRAIGNNSVLAQSITKRLIDGATLSYTFASDLKRQGYRVLADLATLGIPYQGSGLWARRGFVIQSPDIVEKVLTGLLEAIAFIQDPANKASVVRSLARWLHLPKVDDAVEGYDLMKRLYERKIYPDVQGIRNSIRLLGAANEKIRGLKAEDVIEDKIVKKLEQQGLF